MDNEFELPEYYNTKKPKEKKEDLVKRKCFACRKKKLWVSLKDIVVIVAEQGLQDIIKHQQYKLVI